MQHDISGAYAIFGEPVTIAGLAELAIVDLASQLALGDALVQAPALRVQAGVVVGEGAPCTVRGKPYTVRQVLELPPDAAELQIVLAEV